MTQLIKKGNVIINKLLSNRYEIIIDKTFLYKNYVNHIHNLLSRHLDINNKIKDNKTIFNLKLDSVITLSNLLKEKKHKLSYHHAQLLFKHFVSTINALNNDNISMYNINMSNIIVLNTEKTKFKTIFLYINTNDFKIINNNHINIDEMVDKNNIFISPELYDLNTIPKSIHINTIYFSIASLISYCLKKFNDNNHDKLFYLKHLDIIQDTKLYWALLRCLNHNPDDRYAIFI